MTECPVNPQLLLLQVWLPPFRGLKFPQTECGFVHAPCPNKQYKVTQCHSRAKTRAKMSPPRSPHGLLLLWPPHCHMGSRLTTVPRSSLRPTGLIIPCPAQASREPRLTWPLRMEPQVGAQMSVLLLLWCGRKWQLLLGRGWMSIPKGLGKEAHQILGQLIPGLLSGLPGRALASED